ncbi:hypothetical protein Pelo_8422 [Pelomyxa schiedti]|nr:hypothetical protein Pelo_8422 [Pelomyxa schiedti]
MSQGRGRGTLPAGALGPAAGAGTGTGTGINTRLTEDGESADPRVAEIGRLARRCMEGTDMGGDVLEATTDLRRLLSTETNPPIRIVVNSGVIPRLVQFIGMVCVAESTSGTPVTITTKRFRRGDKMITTLSLTKAGKTVSAERIFHKLP